MREAFLNTHASKIEPEVLAEPNEEQLQSIGAEDMTLLCLSRARERRTLKPSESYHLPALNLTKYMREHEVAEDDWLKAKGDYETLKKQRAVSIVDSQKDYSNYLDNLTELINKQLRRYAKLFRKREKTFWEGRALVDVAYESRKVYVDTLMSEKTNIKGKNKRNNKNNEKRD